jgi:hypothetical protein
MVRILFALIVAAPVTALAAQVCMEVPDGVTYESIQTNFDGSVTITTPKVFVNGAYVYLFPEGNTGVGFCKFLDKAIVQFSQDYLEDSAVAAYMDTKGRFAGTTSAVKFIDRISCREKQVP